MYGTPQDWFGSHGWRVYGAEQGSEWEPVARAILGMATEVDPEKRPSVAWFKTRKGRGYGKYDYGSHGVAARHEQRALLGAPSSRSPRSTASSSPTMGGPAPADPAAAGSRVRARTWKR